VQTLNFISALGARAIGRLPHAGRGVEHLGNRLPVDFRILPRCTNPQAIGSAGLGVLCAAAGKHRCELDLFPSAACHPLRFGGGLYRMGSVALVSGHAV